MIDFYIEKGQRLESCPKSGGLATETCRSAFGLGGGEPSSKADSAVPTFLVVAPPLGEGSSSILGGRAVKVSWPDVDQRRVRFLTQDVTELCEAPEQLWEYAFYLQKKGDPKTNGHLSKTHGFQARSVLLSALG